MIVEELEVCIEKLRGDSKNNIKICICENLPNYDKYKFSASEKWRKFIFESIGSEILKNTTIYQISISFVDSRTLTSTMMGISIMPIIWIDVGQKDIFRIDIIDENSKNISYIIGKC